MALIFSAGFDSYHPDNGKPMVLNPSSKNQTLSEKSTRTERITIKFKNTELYIELNGQLAYQLIGIPGEIKIEINRKLEIFISK
jgi:hypothetical protein